IHNTKVTNTSFKPGSAQQCARGSNACLSRIASRKHDANIPLSLVSVALLCVPHSSASLGLVEASAAVSSVHTLRCHAPIRVLAGRTRLGNH
ncbi:hypothetical protein, conserved in T. vivax, partial [Trypanosoma vivax Y486]